VSVALTLPEDGWRTHGVLPVHDHLRPGTWRHVAAPGREVDAITRVGGVLHREQVPLSTAQDWAVVGEA
jgi:hypothetical protein